MRRRQAITDSAVILPVRGFSLGTLRIVISASALSERTRTVCWFRSTPGSAHISTAVRSGPIPASASAAATLTLAGNPMAASRAEPLKTRFGSVSPSIEMPLRRR